MATSGTYGDKNGYTQSKKVNGRFVNPFSTWKDPSISSYIFKVFIKDKITGSGGGLPSKAKLDEDLPIVKPDFTSWQHPDDGMKVMWIGHATVLVQLDGFTIITDPQFSEKSSPIQWLMGASRYRAAPCREAELPKLDAVLISHTHYDHLDVDSCRNLHSKFGKELSWFVPLGLRRWMLDLLSLPSDSTNVHEMDWWQETPLDFTLNRQPVQVAFTPAQHWCKRTPTDDNQVLWGSWCVLGKKRKFFFAGDTGYCEAFKQIGGKYGPFDLAAIPIGAYSPRWFMSPQHVDPDQAVQIHQDVRAARSLGIHWGTFRMTYEPVMEPKQKLSEAVSKYGLSADAFITLHHGESRVFKSSPL